MLIKGNNYDCRPMNAEEGDIYIDLSTGNKYVFRCNEWVNPAVRPDLPVASATKAGVVKIGDRLTITDGGVLSADAVPVASASAPGIMQVGTGLDVTEEGVVSVHTEEEQQ